MPRIGVALSDYLGLPISLYDSQEGGLVYSERYSDPYVKIRGCVPSHLKEGDEGVFKHSGGSVKGDTYCFDRTANAFRRVDVAVVFELI